MPMRLSREDLRRLGKNSIDQLKEAGIDTEDVVTKVHKYRVSSKDLRTEDGITFDSKLELNVYRYLRDHHIEFQRQVVFILEEGFVCDGKKYRAVKYICDFLLSIAGNKLCVDAKGMCTKMFALKSKLMLKKYNIVIYCVGSVVELVELLHKHKQNNKCITYV